MKERVREGTREGEQMSATPVQRTFTYPEIRRKFS